MNKDNKKFIIETQFLKETLKHNLSLDEFLILMYFDNDYDSSFDVKKISKATCLKEDSVMKAFESLMSKGLIVLSSVKNESGKIVDKISLDNLYNDIKKDTEKDLKKSKKDDFFSQFQKEYNHTLSSMDYEIINAWLQNGYTEELILGAVKEANYYDVASIRYIDRILLEWSKKGFKTMDDVNKHLTEKNQDSDDESLFDTNVMNINWLDNE